MRKERLIAEFKYAKACKKNFIGVAILLPNTEGVEVIINEPKNFDYKLNYYTDKYNDKMELKVNPLVKVVAVKSSDSVNDIMLALKEATL